MSVAHRADELFGSGRPIDAARVFPLRLLMDPLVDRLGELEPGWDGYHAAPPSDRALHRTDRLLGISREEQVEPDRIVPDASGGVAAYIFARPLSRKRFAQILCSNDGAATVLLSDRSSGATEVLDVAGDGEFRAVLGRIKEWVQ